MARMVRMVPPDWEHPRYLDGHYMPLHCGYMSDLKSWELGLSQWESGLREHFSRGWVKRKESDGATYEEWAGDRPNPDMYMPDWPEEKRTHLMMYEICSEGTPISPAFKTPEALARWLVDNNASAFGQTGASYDAWLRVARGGYAVGCVISNGVATSGVEAMKDDPIL